MKVCIVASTSWLTHKTIGGAEKQISYIALALVKAGHSVDLYTTDIDTHCEESGVHIIPAWNNTKGIKTLRLFIYRLPYLRRQILDNQYDLIYMRGYPIFAPGVISAAKKARVVSVLGLASNANISWKHWKSARPGRSNWWYCLECIKHAYYRYGALRKANILGVQNSFQRIFVQKFNRNTLFIPNIYIPSKAYSNATIRNNDIAWIGHFQFTKGIQYLPYLINRLSNYSFTIVGKCKGIQEGLILEKIIEKENVCYHSYLDNELIKNLLASSKLLLSTSPFEGFPNTFLEAWYERIPVISLYADPNKLLNEYGLGYCSEGDSNDLISIASDLLESESARKEIGERARNYVLKNHDQKYVVSIFEQIHANLALIHQ